MAVAIQSELGRWLQEFHTTANKSYAGSLHYLKTLSNVALSSVLFNKGIFPKKSYIVEYCDGEIIPMLKKTSACRQANVFHSWITGFQEAIDKKYLRTVVLTFFDSKQPEIPIEETKITFKYNVDNITFDSSGEFSTIREDTLNFLKATTDVVKGFGEFPKQYQIAINLTYYDDVTPADYEPPGFTAGEGSEEPEEVLDWKRIVIGSLATPCHKMRMMASKVLPPPLPSQSASESGKDHNAESEESDPIGNSPTYDAIEPPLTFDTRMDNLFSGDNLFNIKGDFAENTAKSRKVAGRSRHEAEDVELHCPCGKRFIEETIRCKSCQNFQHSICFGLLAPVDPPEHYCDKCAKDDPRLTCTDPEFPTMYPEYKKETCLFRNALAVCKKHRAISLDTIQQNLQVSTKTAVLIINELEKSSVFYSTTVNPEDITHPRLINHIVLQTNILPRYFKNLRQSQGQGAYLDLKSLDHNIIAEELDDTPNVFSQKDMEDYDREVEASFSREITNLQITASPKATRQSTRRKRVAERFTPEESFSYKRKKSAGKVDSSKNRRLHNN